MSGGCSSSVTWDQETFCICGCGPDWSGLVITKLLKCKEDRNSGCVHS